MAISESCPVVTAEVTDEKLGERLKILREMRGTSQDKVAQYIHSDRSFVSRMETGDREVKLRFWPGLAQALDLTIDTFALMLFFDISHEQADTISKYIARCKPRNRW